MITINMITAIEEYGVLIKRVASNEMRLSVLAILCAIVFIFALGLFVCAVVLFWRRKSWRYTRLPNPTDVFYVS